MPRGGSRKGAGRKTSWASGCQFEDTKVVRVPKEIASEVLEIAHKLDEGAEVVYDDSLKVENQKLKEQVEQLEEEVESLKESSLVGLPLFSQNKVINDLDTNSIVISAQDLQDIKNEVLRSLRMGEQSKVYKQVKKSLNQILKRLVD